MTQQATAVNNTPLSLFSKFSLYSKKLAAGLETLGEGFYLIYRHGLYKDPNNPVNTRYVQYFCRRLCDVFNVEVEVHGTIPREPALWVSNHSTYLFFGQGRSGKVAYFRKLGKGWWDFIY